MRSEFDPTQEELFTVLGQVSIALASTLKRIERAHDHIHNGKPEEAAKILNNTMEDGAGFMTTVQRHIRFVADKPRVELH